MKLRHVSFRKLRFAIIFVRLTVYWCRAIHSAKDVPVYHEECVLGDRVNLPCDISVAEGPHEHEDCVVLVLWYREDLGTPIFSVDTRERGFQNAEKWSDDRVFGSRAFFVSGTQPARLSVDNVKKTDEGIYRCRVDFKFAQTRNSKVILTVIVPPQRIIVTDEWGKVRTSVVGPYLEAATLKLTCDVIGGKPAPNIVWYKREQRACPNETYVLASLASGSIGGSGGAVSLPVSIAKLNRADLHAELTCQAFNSNRTNLSSVLQIDMNLKPMDVRIMQANQPLVAGRLYDIVCQSSGSRPPAKLTWWKNAGRLDKTKDTTSSDGNTSTSVLQFMPRKEDSNQYLSCRSENQLAGADKLETGWKLQINYLPEVRISLGASLKSEAIEEGADVYFDCIVDALPSIFKVDWKLNGRILHHRVGGGVIISNYSLALQRVNRSRAGNYTCVAYNAIGEGESDIFTLNVLYVPTCKSNQTRVYGVAKLERVNVSCEVEANPTDVVFRWSFNNSQETIDLVSTSLVHTNSTLSVVSHVPLTEMDYGTLLCYASNKIGPQRTPCFYHVIAAAKPERVSNCSVSNVTATDLDVACVEGFGGGQPQTFYLELNAATLAAAAEKKMSSASVPRFHLSDLRANTRYMVSVYSVNLKGRSEATEMDVHTAPTLQMPSGRPRGSNEDDDGGGGSHQKEKFRTAAVTNMVVGVVVALMSIACLVAAILRIRSVVSGQNRLVIRKSSPPPIVIESLLNGQDEKLATATAGSLINKVLLSDGYGASIALVDAAAAAADEKDPDLIPHPPFDTRLRCDNELRIKTIETKAAAPLAAATAVAGAADNDPSCFVNCILPSSGKWSCSSTNDYRWRSYPLWSHSNEEEEEEIKRRTLTNEISPYMTGIWRDDGITPDCFYENKPIDSLYPPRSLTTKINTTQQISSISCKSPKHESTV